MNFRISSCTIIIYLFESFAAAEDVYELTLDGKNIHYLSLDSFFVAIICRPKKSFYWTLFFPFSFQEILLDAL